jgi:serine/threonine protein kinase
MKFEKENDLIFWECCNGGNLLSFINYFNTFIISFPLEEILIQKIIKQIVKGLECLHKNNNKKIISGLSLNNIFINFKGIKKEELWNNNGLIRKQYDLYKQEDDIDLIDIKMRFFVSKEERKKEMKSNYNTSEYTTNYSLAPEILDYPNCDIDPIKSNMWSLGVITYQLLTGNKILFKGKNSKEILDKINEGKMPIESGLTPSLQIINFITSLLKFYPKDRPKLEDLKNSEFLKLNPENFDFINIKFLAKKNNQIILDLKEEYPINKYLVNTNLRKKIPKKNLRNSSLLFIDNTVNANKEKIEELKNEYKNKKNITSDDRIYYPENIKGLQLVNGGLLQKKEEILAEVNNEEP